MTQLHDEFRVVWVRRDGAAGTVSFGDEACDAHEYAAVLNGSHPTFKAHVECRNVSSWSRIEPAEQASL